MKVGNGRAGEEKWKREGCTIIEQWKSSRVVESWSQTPPDPPKKRRAPLKVKDEEKEECRKKCVCVCENNRIIIDL